MEGDTEDDDNLFDLGDDDDEEEQEDVVDGGEMGNDPYDANDWDILDTPEGQEEPVEELEESGELLFDIYEDDDYVGDGDDDLNDLMDKGLEEVDDILRKKGRLNVASNQRLEETELTGATADSGAVPNADSSQHSLTQGANANGARGTGAQAASTLRAFTAPSGARRPYGSQSIEIPIQQAIPLSRAAAETRSNGNDHEATNDAIPFATADDAVGQSPARRRSKREPPFIQAKGLALTYAQAKLFGLAGATCPGLAPTLSPTGNRPVALSEVLQASRTSTVPGARDNRGGGAFSGCVKGERRPLNGVGTYSPSRMDRLARPVPGRGGVATDDTSADSKRPGWDGTRGNCGGEASFTWRRSRRAEAAMRDPACGYDFVRDSGEFSDQKGFLARVEAYSSYSRTKLETQRAEEVYAARLDKLECPRCTNPQSYDEFASKKLMCPSCDVAYYRPRTWNRSVWERRNEMCAAKSGERQARTEKEAEEEFIRRIPRQSRHAAVLRQRVGQVAFIARMRRDLRKRRARQTSTRDSIRIDALPATDDDHRRYRATATTANAATASSPASSPVDTTKTAATRHHAAMKLTHSAVAEGGRSYHYARGATSNEAPASTVVSKEAQPPVPDTANNPVSSRKPHQSATQNGHGPSPNILATPTGPRVTARDDSDVHRGGDGMSRGDQITRPFTAHNLTTEGPRAASLLRNRERGRGTA